MLNMDRQPFLFSLPQSGKAFLFFLPRFDASINKKRTYLIDMFFQFF